MFVKADQLFSQANAETWYANIFQFPLTRIIIAFIFLIPVGILSTLVGPSLYRHFDEPFFTIIRYSRDIVFLIIFVLMYGLYTRVIEKRDALELSTPKLFKEFGIGALISFAVVGFMVLLMFVLGYYVVDGFDSFKNVSDSFFAQIMVGFTEELMFRLILFKLVEEFAGSWWALIVQGLLFGFAHIGNPNASVWTSLGIVADSTLLLGCGYMLTRRLWLVMGMHMSWNFFQAGIFGMPNSGIIQASLIQPAIDGPIWITGGAWGIEASVISVTLNVLIGLFILKKAIDNGQLVLPMWKRNKIESVENE